MDISNVEGRKMGATRWGTRQKKRDCGAGLQGPTGNWGVGCGRQESECKNGWWGPEGVEYFPGGQVVQDFNRG